MQYMRLAMRYLFHWLPWVWIGFSVTTVQAAEWPVTVMPQQIELEGDEGDRVVQDVVLENREDWPAPVRLEAVNWHFGSNGQRQYSETLELPNDCRDWWVAGRDDLLIQPNASLVYRLEIVIPDDIEETECHFGLAVIPVGGDGQYARRYVPVYINAEDAEPELELLGLKLGKDGAGKRQPFAVIKNSGSARSKLYGMLEGEDAQGQEVDIILRSTELLAGETREVPLIVSRPGGGDVWWSTPLEVEGSLIWDDGEIDIDEVLN